MALQSQTYANSGNGYYIQGRVPNNPSTITALNGPVEILLTSTIKGEYYGNLDQSLSTFTISENKTATLSTINFLTMDAVNQKITMGINDVTTPFPVEPVIQQWNLTSSIVNGVFKVGTKQLNNEANALNIINNAQTTTLKQNDTTMFIDGLNERTRFGNIDNPFKYTEIDNTADSAGTVSLVNAGSGGVFSQIVVDPEEIKFYSASQIYGRTGVNNAIPNQYYMSSKGSIEFVTDDLNKVYTPLKLRQDGNIDVLSTINVPSIYNETDIRTPKIIQLFTTASTPINVEGSFSLTTDTSVYALPGFNYVEAPRIRVKGTPSFPKTYFSPGNSESQIIQNTLIATAGAPASAFNSMEFIQNSGDTVGGFQFYHGTDGSLALPQWLGGFTNNPKQFILASTMTASLPFITDTQTASIQVLNNVSTASITAINNVSTASVVSLTNVSSINGRNIKTFTEPTGMMVPYAPYIGIAPDGWLICDGSSYGTATYPDLYALIGTSYGGGGATFAVPDMRGRASMGTVATNQNSGPSGGNVTSVSAIARVPGITIPANWPGTGGVTDGYLCQGDPPALYPGMRCITSGYDGVIRAVIIVPTGLGVVPQYIIVCGTTVTSGFPATLQFVFLTNNDASFAPCVANNLTGSPGTGDTQIYLEDYNVPYHTHGYNNGDGRAYNVAGAPDLIGDLGGRTTTGNSGLWSYTHPITSVAYTGSSGLPHVPLNVATWFIIKT